MGRFSRDAPWIRRIFPASGVPATAQPSAVSEDIQLTQDYLANGQTQSPTTFFIRENIVNPGLNLSVGLVVPGAITTAPEVWRVFYVSVRAPAGPVADFDFFIQIDNPSIQRAVTISRLIRILIADTRGMPVFPTGGDGVPGTTSGGVWINSSPLILSSGESGQNSTLTLLQTSAQGVSTLGLEVTAYVLRNQVGLAHIL